MPIVLVECSATQTNFQQDADVMTLIKIIFYIPKKIFWLFYHQTKRSSYEERMRERCVHVQALIMETQRRRQRVLANEKKTALIKRDIDILQSESYHLEMHKSLDKMLEDNL
jgi:hypothetical protein